METTVGDHKVRKPNYKDLTQAQLYSSKVFNDARQTGAILRDNLDNYIREQGLWDDEKQNRLIEIMDEMNKIISELKKGKLGEYKKLSEARRAAIRLRILRSEQTQLLAQQRSLDSYTAEGQAEQARFNYLSSVCILNNDSSPAFSSLDDYLENADEEWVVDCVEELSYYIYPNADRDWQWKLPENRFLKKHGLINEDGRLVNKKGHLVDGQMRLVNEEGDLVDEEGNRVNEKGERIDEDGYVVGDYEEFENDL